MKRNREKVFFSFFTRLHVHRIQEAQLNCSFYKLKPIHEFKTDLYQNSNTISLLTKLLTIFLPSVTLRNASNRREKKIDIKSRKWGNCIQINRVFLIFNILWDFTCFSSTNKFVFFFRLLLILAFQLI